MSALRRVAVVQCLELYSGLHNREGGCRNFTKFLTFYVVLCISWHICWYALLALPGASHPLRLTHLTKESAASKTGCACAAVVFRIPTWRRNSGRIRKDREGLRAPLFHFPKRGLRLKHFVKFRKVSKEGAPRCQRPHSRISTADLNR